MRPNMSVFMNGLKTACFNGQPACEVLTRFFFQFADFSARNAPPALVIAAPDDSLSTTGEKNDIISLSVALFYRPSHGGAEEAQEGRS